MDEQNEEGLGCATTGVLTVAVVGGVVTALIVVVIVLGTLLIPALF
jgi:hypothetical protein